MLDNFDNEYGLFRRGAEVQRAGLGGRVIVPVTTSDEPDAAAAAMEVAKTFARMANLQNWELVVVPQEEPISLTTARRVGEVLQQYEARSVTLVSPGFRSRRSQLIYGAVLAKSGVVLNCLPVFGAWTPETFTQTWHGIQDVVLQFMKLQYYRFWVLPRTRSV